jgi:hypothetical protein
MRRFDEGGRSESVVIESSWSRADAKPVSTGRRTHGEASSRAGPGIDPGDAAWRRWPTSQATSRQPAGQRATLRPIAASR